MNGPFPTAFDTKLRSCNEQSGAKSYCATGVLDGRAVTSTSVTDGADAQPA